MAEVMDIQARKDIYHETSRAKDAESSLGFAIEALRQELEDLKKYVESIDLSRDDVPTWNSEKLLSSGTVYESIRTLNSKIDSLR